MVCKSATMVTKASFSPPPHFGWSFNTRVGLQEMGMAMPSDFSAESVGAAVGWGERVRTIDVATQQAGPRLTLGMLRASQGIRGWVGVAKSFCDVAKARAWAPLCCLGRA